MGVQGWTYLLRKEGYLPSKDAEPCCSGSPWRTASSSLTANNDNHEFANRLVVLPPGSELHIDGNGLVFLLHRVAYARHVAQVLQRPSNKKKKKRCNKKPCALPKKVTAQQARQLLPNLLPMQLLADVTQEFVQQLQNKHHMKLKVYWDGEKSRAFKTTKVEQGSNFSSPSKSFKAATEEKRQEQRPEEWSNLHLYCVNGVLPSVFNACELEGHFPKCRYFQCQVAETLVSCGGGIAQVTCLEEADVEMARAVSGRSNAYILGQDSDFCFFPRVNYILFSTLNASSSAVTAIVLTRDELAHELDLPNEEAMVEVAILLGNDYVHPTQVTFHDRPPTIGFVDSNEVLEFVRNQGPGYRVTSPSEETQEILTFVRNLYQLDSLDEFELVDKSMDQSHLLEDDEEEEEDQAPGDAGYRPRVPKSVPTNLLAMDPRVDRSVKDAVVRCLQAYIDATETADEGQQKVPMISRQQLEAFALLDFSSPRSMDKEEKDWRPLWDDIPAAYLIEKMIWKAFDQKSPLAHMALPSSCFDAHLFFQRMHEIRLGEADLSVSDEEEENSKPLAEMDFGQKQVLPIDEHEERILDSIARNRVTIIKGETGCGKSSRIPVMVLNAPPPDPSLPEVKIFISQPRRIAAKGLVERVRAVEPELGKRFALRLGHGLREYESDETRAWFCTTGYLVRLVANHPERFDDISHLIIDEIHDRGVDLDLLCLLCRRLLHVNKKIRLVLMSATLAAALYQQYFGTTEPPIEVGARRFPVTEVFLDDLVANNSRIPLSQKVKKTANSLLEECGRLKCKLVPSTSYLDKLEALASQIIATIGKGGTSILVFVPGMNEIIAIIDLVEQLFVPGTTFTTIPVHSEIPFELQMEVFSQAKSDECRIIVATNSAESSVTLPALDHVIDLGLCRQIVYNQASHRQMLTSAWISRASATQRAGRTGRIREGTVYRLYSRDCFQHHMLAFEPGEMLRIPLDSVILMLKGILPHEESSTQALLDCLEPPSETTIDRSYDSLYNSRYISSPNDHGEITNLGSFVSALGTDLSLGSLIGLGIQFGVGPEAIQLAGVLSFPKPPWIISNPLIHEPEEFNSMSATTFVSRCHFDSNLFSEPFATMNLIWDFENTQGKQGWCWKYGISLPRAKRLASTCSNLKRRVADLLELRSQFLDVEGPPRSMPPAKIAILRAIQVWVFHDTMIEWKPPKKSSISSGPECIVPLEKKGDDSVSEAHLEQILIPERHQVEVRIVKVIEQSGSFEPLEAFDQKVEGHHEDRLVSYAIEKDFSLLFYWSKEVFVVYLSDAAPTTPNVEAVLERLGYAGTLSARASTLSRGIGERDCGKWTVSSTGGQSGNTKSFRKYYSASLQSKQSESFSKDLDSAIRTNPMLKSLNLQLTTNNKKKAKFTFSVKLNGRGIEPVSPKDLNDLLFNLEPTKPQNREFVTCRELAFPLVENGPWYPKKKHKPEKPESWPTPLLDCIPEGARLIASLAAATRRREQVIWLHPLAIEDETNDDDSSNNEEEEMEYMGLYPNLKGMGTWSRLNAGTFVYLPDLSVPRFAVPIDQSLPLQCCCANALEIRGGALKVEGLTLLPPGRLFSFLCRLSFGLEDIDLEVDPMISLRGFGPDGGSIPIGQEDEILERCSKAQELNERARHLGEALVCEPSMVEDLLLVFDGLYESLEPWSSLNDNPFTSSNLKRGKDHRRSETPKPKGRGRTNKGQTNNHVLHNYSSPDHAVQVENGAARSEPAIHLSPKDDKKAPSSQQPTTNATKPQKISMPKHVASLFATQLQKGQQVGTNELPSPNILALVLEKYAASQTKKKEKSRRMKFDDTGSPAHWSLYRITQGSKECFQARFDAQDLAPRCNSTIRPNNLSTVLESVPDTFSQALLHGSLETKHDGVFYESVDTAVRLECAMWLEQQFRQGSTHWYLTSLPDMVKQLVQRGD